MRFCKFEFLRGEKRKNTRERRRKKRWGGGGGRRASLAKGRKGERIREGRGGVNRASSGNVSDVDGGGGREVGEMVGEEGGCGSSSTWEDNAEGGRGKGGGGGGLGLRER